MGCNCTANLRADIIKRFFANQFNGKEFALELIRIVECQQDVMSRELEDWFKIWFRFPQDMLEEFLACVMKRQATMSDRLQKVIRARFFPTDQRMADDFIRVVLCSCCPAICGTDIDIIGIYEGVPGTPDGWYLQRDASNIIYVESDAITQTVPCESGLADYGHPNGNNGGYESPHVYSDGLGWQPLTEVEPPLDLGGNDYRFYVYNPNQPVVDFTGGNILVEYSTNGGATWLFGATSTEFNNPTAIEFNTGTDTFIYRTIVTLANGCQFYNPAPDNSSAPITYFILDDPFMGQFGGWTFNGTDLLDFRDNVLPTLPNFLFDASVDEAGDSLYVAFSGVNAPTITVVDAVSDPVVLDWITLIAKIPCLSATFTVIDPSDTIIEYLMIGSYIITASALTITNPLCATEIQSAMRANGFGSLTEVEINIAGNDVTITFRNTNGLITGIRWIDSAMNTGDETLTTCI